MPAPQLADTLSTVMSIFWVFIGILISLILPIAVKVLKPQRSTSERDDRSTLWQKIAGAWEQYSGSKYLMKFLAAVFVAIVLVLLLGLEFSTVRDAVLAGFAWESLLNKLMGQG